MPFLRLNQENENKGLFSDFNELPEFTLIIIFVISLKNENFRLKMKVLNVHGIQPSMNSKCRELTAYFSIMVTYQKN